MAKVKKKDGDLKNIANFLYEGGVLAKTPVVVFIFLVQVIKRWQNTSIV